MNFKDFEWINIILPSIITGLIAGVAEFAAKQEIGYEAAAYAAGITFLIVFLNDLKDKLVPKTTAVRNKPKKNLRLFAFHK